jgi:hypothetical protein
MTKAVGLSSQHAMISLVFLVKNLYPIRLQATTSISRRGLGIVLQKGIPDRVSGVLSQRVGETVDGHCQKM